MRPVPLHREIETRDEKDAVAPFVIKSLFSEIGCNGLVIREILPVFPVVIHILEQRHRCIEMPVSPAERRGDAAQEAQAVAVIAGARIAEIVEHRLHLLRRQILLDIHVLVVQRVGEDRHAPPAGLLERGHLAFVEIEAAAEDDHGVGAAERLSVRRHRIGIGKAQPDLPGVVVEGHVSLLGEGGVDDQYAGRPEKGQPKHRHQQEKGGEQEEQSVGASSLCLPHTPASSS